MSVPAIDTFQSILAAEADELAAVYVFASQYTHATELAARSSRTDLGDSAAYGDFVGAKGRLQPV